MGAPRCRRLGLRLILWNGGDVFCIRLCVCACSAGRGGCRGKGSKCRRTKRRRGDSRIYQRDSGRKGRVRTRKRKVCEIYEEQGGQLTRRQRLTTTTGSSSSSSKEERRGTTSQCINNKKETGTEPCYVMLHVTLADGI